MPHELICGHVRELGIARPNHKQLHSSGNIPGREHAPAIMVTTPAPIPAIVGVMGNMMFCSTEPEAIISMGGCNDHECGQYLDCSHQLPISQIWPP